MAVSRAEEAEKKLSEKLNEIQALKVQLRDAKVSANDLKLKLATSEQSLKSAGSSIPAQAPP